MAETEKRVLRLLYPVRDLRPSDIEVPPAGETRLRNLINGMSGGAVVGWADLPAGPGTWQIGAPGTANNVAFASGYVTINSTAEAAYLAVSDSNSAVFRGTSYRAASAHVKFQGGAARGTLAAPGYLLSGDDVVEIGAYAWDGTGVLNQPVGRLRIYAASNHSAGVIPGAFDLRLNAGGVGAADSTVIGATTALVTIGPPLFMAGGGLTFTDNTYDIGATATGRPRDLFLARDLTVGGQQITVGTSRYNGKLGVSLAIALGSIAHDLQVGAATAGSGSKVIGVRAESIAGATARLRLARGADVAYLDFYWDANTDTARMGVTGADKWVIAAASTTFLQDLLFTDNTYDIGKAGATRPRNLFTSGTITAGGNVTVQKTTLPTFVAEWVGTTSKARFAKFAVGNSHLTDNVSFDGTNWNLDDITLSGDIWSFGGSTPLRFRHVTAGANPRTPEDWFGIESTGVAVFYKGTVKIQDLTGTDKAIEFRMGAPAVTGSRRWVIRSSSGPEVGADAGSNFIVDAYTDAGGLIDSPLSIVRAAGGALGITRPVTISRLTTSGAFGEPGLILQTTAVAVSNVTHKASPYLLATGSIWNGAAAVAKSFGAQVQGISGQNSQYVLTFGSTDISDILVARGDTGWIGIGVKPTAALLHTEKNLPGSFIGYFRNSAAAGSSYGLLIDAGGNSGDEALTVRDRTGATVFFKITGAGVIQFGGNQSFIADNSYDIGPAGSNRPRDVFVGRDVNAGQDVTVGRNINMTSGAGADLRANIDLYVTFDVVSVGGRFCTFRSGPGGDMLKLDGDALTVNGQTSLFLMRRAVGANNIVRVMWKDFAALVAGDMVMVV